MVSTVQSLKQSLIVSWIAASVLTSMDDVASDGGEYGQLTGGKILEEKLYSPSRARILR